MNSITTINTPSVLTMSSREIAELTEKEHKHVKRDIEVMLAQLGEDGSKFGRIYLDSMNRQQGEYRLPKRETTILVSGYSVVLRARIVDRWMELEEQAKGTSIALPDFGNPAIAARAWAEQYEQRLAAEGRAKGCVPNFGETSTT